MMYLELQEVKSVRELSSPTSPSLYIVRLPRLLKTAPKVLVETALWSTALGNNQKSPEGLLLPRFYNRKLQGA